MHYPVAILAAILAIDAASLVIANPITNNELTLAKRHSCSTPYGGGTCKDSSLSSCGGQYVSGYCYGGDNVECCVSLPTCSTPSGSGSCAYTSRGCQGGHYVPGYCPGPDNYQCCVKAPSCSTPKGQGSCLSTSQKCSSGAFVSGYCPGPSTTECCVKGAHVDPPPPPPPPPPSQNQNLAAFDISDAQTDKFWTCAGSRYNKAIIRGYEQACGVGGKVDPNLADSVTAAKAAGITRIDAYMFPCTGKQRNGVRCKSPATQISEFEAAIKAAGLNPGFLWLDVESCDSSNPCTCWNEGELENEALAKDFVRLMDASSFKWGVYGNGNDWTSIFSSRHTDIGSHLPLWAVQDDNIPGTSTVYVFMGGWTEAHAKQFSLDITSCHSTQQAMDLNTFNA